MFKFKKLAAVAAAAVMAVSAMAINASAQTTYTGDIPTPCGTYKGALSINGGSGNFRVVADTIMVNGTAPEVAVVLFAFNSRGQQIYYDDPVNYNASYCAASTNIYNQKTVSAQSHHIVSNGTTTWSEMLTL